MPKFSLSRRAVLRGAGTIAIGLPFLEAMRPEKAFGQASNLAKRFISVYTPGGTVGDKWKPTGASETNFTLSPILSPLNPVKDKLLVLDGLEMKCALGEQHQAGIIGFLTGSPQSGANRDYSAAPSIDQIIAKKASVGKRFGSLQIAMRWATGKSKGLLHPINSVNFEDNATFNPIPPRLDPQAIWNDLFGTINASMNLEAAAKLERKKSILDYVDRKHVALMGKLGASDKAKLDQHLTKIREIETSLKQMPVPNTTCQPPTLINTSDYNPRTGLNSDDGGGIKDVSTDAAIPKVGKLMMDMMVMALACDLTSTISYQWTDTEAKHTFPWLQLNEHHHYYQHDGGYRPAELERIYTWYSQQHAYLLGELRKIDMGGHSLLDESVVFFGSELADPPSHSKRNMPFLLAGGGGGLRGGRWVRYANDRSHNDLLSGILALFGENRTVVGDARFCTTPVNNLT